MSFASYGTALHHQGHRRRRRYGEADLYRVAVILRAKEAGFGLDDIREFAAHDPSARTKILQRRQRTGTAHRESAGLTRSARLRPRLRSR
jgi:DNA-binding transcriptional MerR regulator